MHLSHRKDMNLGVPRLECYGLNGHLSPYKVQEELVSLVEIMVDLWGKAMLTILSLLSMNMGYLSTYLGLL
jgi:hypothetical protein